MGFTWIILSDLKHLVSASLQVSATKWTSGSLTCLELRVCVYQHADSSSLPSSPRSVCFQWLFPLSLLPPLSFTTHPPPPHPPRPSSCSTLTAADMEEWATSKKLPQWRDICVSENKRCCQKSTSPPDVVVVLAGSCRVKEEAGCSLRHFPQSSVRRRPQRVWNCWKLHFNSGFCSSIKGWTFATFEKLNLEVPHSLKTVAPSNTFCLMTTTFLSNFIQININQRFLGHCINNRVLERWLTSWLLSSSDRLLACSPLNNPQHQFALLCRKCSLWSIRTWKQLRLVLKDGSFNKLSAVCSLTRQQNTNNSLFFFQMVCGLKKCKIQHTHSRYFLIRSYLWGTCNTKLWPAF